MSEASQAIGTNIVQDPTIHGGEPIVGGTATTVRAVAELWNSGMPSEEIPLHLPHLKLVHVLEALHYYLRHREEIDRFIQANRVPLDWSGKRYDPATGKPQ